MVELLTEFIKFIFFSILIVLIAKYLLVRILRKLGVLLNLKPKTVGNIAGIATSIPELLTVSFSAFTGLISTSVYNILSSNIINTIQYGASVVLNKNQKQLRNKAIRIDLVLVAVTIIIPILMMIMQVENKVWIVPIFAVLFLLFYKITNNSHRLYIHHEKESIIDDGRVETSHISVETNPSKKVFSVFIQAVLLAIVGILLYFIGDLLADSLNNLCRIFQIPEWILGILLGFITSLPELITFFESQKHHTDDKEGVVEATSNLLTSNIMNLFVIQSIGIIIYLFVVK